MKLFLSAHFKRDFQKLPPQAKQKVKKQLKFLIKNPSYPSLGVKKIKGKYGGRQFWEARVDRFWRMSFQKVKNGIRLCRLGPHDKVLKSR